MWIDNVITHQTHPGNGTSGALTITLERNGIAQLRQDFPCLTKGITFLDNPLCIVAKADFCLLLSKIQRYISEKHGELYKNPGYDLRIRNLHLLNRFICENGDTILLSPAHYHTRQEKSEQWRRTMTTYLKHYA